MANKKSKPVSKVVFAPKPTVEAVVVAPVAVTPAVVAAPATPAAAPAAVAASATPAVAVASPRIEGARDRSTVIGLIAKLRNHDAEVARDAAARLGTLPPDAEAVDALASVVQNRDGFFHSVVRAAAATSLGKLGDRRAVEALIEGTRDAMAEASEEAVKALGLLNDKRALPALEVIVKNAQGFFLENVRKTAEESIRQISGR